MYREGVSLYELNLDRINDGTKSVEILVGMDQIWNEYVQHVTIICNVFLFLDRVFVLTRPELSSLWSFNMQLFRAHVMSEEVCTALIPALLQTIERDRRSEMSEVGKLLASFFRMFADLKLMDECVNSAVAESTTEFFRNKADEKLAELSMAAYLEDARHQIDNEAQRYQNYELDSLFASELIRRVQNALIVSRLDEILNRGLADLIKEESIGIMNLLYRLAEETNCLDCLRTHWLAYIKTTGSSMISESGRDETLIGEVIDLKDRLDRILNQSFASSTVFGDAIKEAFESVLNSRQNRPVELIAKYTDYQLRGGMEKATEAELNMTLDKIITMFRYVQGKDVFEVFFKKDLARRLLLGRSVSVEAEKSFVARLKQECGSSFTSRLESMFKDMEISKDTMHSYQHSPIFDKTVKPGKADFTATVVTSGLWPYPPLLSVNLPEPMSKEHERFEEFYKSQHKGRVLSWHQGLGNCVIKANFPLGTKELQVSVPQALVLTLFNKGRDELTYIEIRNECGLDDANLVRTLQSLSCGKIVVLNKIPNGRDVSVGDSFSFNTEFTSKNQRIRINGSSSRDLPEEATNLNVAIGEPPSDRHYLVDASIVRILKQRKRLHRQELIDTVSNQLKYTLPLADFNKRAPSLIEREFIAQDPEDLDVYTYVA
jgi:cullin-4